MATPPTRSLQATPRTARPAQAPGTEAARLITTWPCNLRPSASSKGRAFRLGERGPRSSHLRRRGGGRGRAVVAPRSMYAGRSRSTARRPPHATRFRRACHAGQGLCSSPWRARRIRHNSHSLALPSDFRWYRGRGSRLHTTERHTRSRSGAHSPYTPHTSRASSVFDERINFVHHGGSC